MVVFQFKSQLVELYSGWILVRYLVVEHSTHPDAVGFLVDYQVQPFKLNHYFGIDYDKLFQSVCFTSFYTTFSGSEMSSGELWLFP